MASVSIVSLSFLSNLMDKNKKEPTKQDDECMPTSDENSERLL